ncbi:MAG: hypothetical protein LBG06_07245, partial [Deltaproteobacteria bacterium]|nr:hypothetical protein [Deltaproteobacteria bacterium]
MKDTENSEGQGGAAPEGPSDGTAPEAAGQSPGPEGGTPAGEAPLPGPELKAPLRARAEGAPKAIQAGPAPPSRQGPPVAIRRPQDVKASSWPRARPGQDKPSPPASPVVVEERLGPDGEPLSLLKASPRLKVPAAPVGGPEPLDGRDAARKEPAVRKSKPSRAPGGAAEPCPAGGEAGGPRTPPAADPEGAAGPAGPSDPEGAAGPEGTSGSAGAAGPARLSLISRILKAFRDPEDGPGAPAGEP